MMVQALLPGCRTMQEATNQREASRSKEPPPESEPSRQYVAPGLRKQFVTTACEHLVIYPKVSIFDLPKHPHKETLSKALLCHASFVRKREVQCTI